MIPSYWIRTDVEGSAKMYLSDEDKKCGYTDGHEDREAIFDHPFLGKERAFCKECLADYLSYLAKT